MRRGRIRSARSLEAFADAVGLRALGLGARMIDIFDREVELVFVSLWVAAILTAAVGQTVAALPLGCRRTERPDH